MPYRRQDLDSQVRFGLRTNEVSGRNATYFFDMLTTDSGAQATMNKIVGAKSTPKKQLTVETDWTYLNLEPGDVVEVRSEILLSPVKARVIEHEVDPRLFCRIVARGL